MSKNTFGFINPRLQMLYDLMPQCNRLGDVGTDHGFLPIYCVQTGKCKTAVASDLRPQPLEIAKKNIRLKRCEAQIETLLCPGLEGYRERECDVIAIAGMGGYTICNILSEWLEVCRRDDYFPGNILFLLQPNTAEPELRKFLWDHAFQIEAESAARDGAHVYLGIKGRFGGNWESYLETECYTGKIMCRRLTENDRIYYESLLRKYANMRKGLLEKRIQDETCMRKIDLCRKIIERVNGILDRSC